MGWVSGFKKTMVTELVADAPRARVVRSLRQMMDEGVLANGQPLPSERALSKLLQVDRGTVRRALVLLDEEGLLRNHNGRTRVVQCDEPRRPGLMRNAVVVFNHTSEESWTTHKRSGWSDYIAHGAVHAVRRAGLNAVALHMPENTSKGLAAIAQDRPRGAIVTDVPLLVTEFVRWANEMRREGTPVVVYGDRPEFKALDRVDSDHAHGSYLLTKWLLASGRKRPMLVWPAPATAYWFPRRVAGYNRAMNEAGLSPVAPLLVPTHSDGGFEALLHRNSSAWTEILRPYLFGAKPVDALILATDGYVMPAAEACRKVGLIPNQDVALAGYDNYWQESPERRIEPTPPMATVDKLNLQLGAKLVELFLERDRGELPPAAQLRLVQPELAEVTDGESY